MTSAIVLGGSRGIGKAISNSLKTIEIDVFAASKNDIDTSDLNSVKKFLEKYNVKPDDIKTIETKYHEDAGDWYVALGWDEKKAIVKMDSVQGIITEIKEI